MANLTSYKGFELPDELLTDWKTLLKYIADMLNVKISFVARIVDDDAEMLVLSEEDQEHPKYTTGSQLKIYGTFCEQTMEHTRKPHIVPDGRTDPQYMDVKDFSNGYISYMGFPVRFPSGELFGTLCVEDDKAHEYQEPHIKLMETCKNLIEAHIALYVDKTIHDRKKLLEAQKKQHGIRNIEPICAHCRKIRRRDQKWVKLETWLVERNIVKFTHGICPECIDKYYDFSARSKSASRNQ